MSRTSGLANALYGITANKHFSGYDPDLGEAITLTGQVVIRYVKDIIDEFLNKALGTTNISYCLYLDTDSSYIELGAVVDKLGWDKLDPHEIVNKLEHFVENIIQPAIDKKLEKLASRLGAKENRMSFKLEGIGPAIILVSKKRYAFDILYNEGVRYDKPKMKVMGMEIVRSSTPSAIKEQLKKGVKLVLEKDESTLQSYIGEVKNSFMNLPYTEIAFPRGCNGLNTYSDSSTIYKAGCPIHIRAALLYNHHLSRMGLEDKYPLIGEGDKIRFVYLKVPNPFHQNVIGFPVKIPEEFGLAEYIDYNTQYEKAFLGPLDSVLSAVQWSPEPKVNLEDFF